jgi:hypothetical protein
MRSKQATVRRVLAHLPSTPLPLPLAGEGRTVLALETGVLRGTALRPVPPPYEHAMADAGFRARVDRGYAGEHDLFDALWWLSHPDDIAPSGAQSPRQLLSLARRSLYGHEPATPEVERYAIAAERERSDREGLVAAVAAAERAEPEPPTGAVETTAPPGVGAMPAVSTRSRSWRFRWGSVLVTALAVVAVLGWSRGPALPGVPARSTVVVEVATDSVDALGLFAGTAGEGPQPRIRSRRLAVVAGTAVIAQLTKGLVCLHLADPGGRATASGACRSIAEFRASGLEVPFPTGSAVLDDVRWLPDGRLQLVTVP